MTVSILRTTDSQTWVSFLDRLPHKDITYYPEYMRVYEDYGDGVGECFVYEDGESLLLYPYLRRPIAGVEVNDTVNPYCYGGPIHNVTDDTQAQQLITNFRRAFDDYACQTGIVSEFIRFHPHLQNQVGYGDLLDVKLYRRHVIIDLAQDEEQLFRQLRRSYRHGIQQAKHTGLQVALDTDHSFIDGFADLYRQSMIRHGQTGYLNFRPDYFRLLAKHLGDKLLLFMVKRHNTVLATALFLPCGDYMDYFLAAATPDAFTLYASHLLIYEVACWARQHGIRMLHLGGGAPSLLFFKQGFSKQIAPYYLGRKIHDLKTYTALSQARWRAMGYAWTGDASYFPGYRYGLE